MTKWLDRQHQAREPEFSKEAFEEAVEGAARELVLELGPQVLFSGPLLSEWFIRYQLDREIARAARHARPLSVVVMTPVATGPGQLSADALDAAAAVATEFSRVTDLAGWLSGNRILLILPETDRDGAAAAAYRLTSDMSRQASNQGRARWTVTARADGHTYGSADDLLSAIAVEAEQEQAIDPWQARRRQRGQGRLSA